MQYCQEPNSRIKKPKFLVPKKACDCHGHVFGPSSRFPFATGRTYTLPDAPLGALVRLYKRLGLSRAVIVQATRHGTENTVTLNAIEQSEGRFRGVAIVDETFSSGQYRELHKDGIRVVRFSFARHIGEALDFDLVKREIEKIAVLSWHVVIHMEARDIAENARVLAELPVPLVIDHMGRVQTGHGASQEPFQLLLELLTNKENCWVKICDAERISSQGVPYHDTIPFAQGCITHTPERVLWGTDWPSLNIENNMPDDSDLINLLSLFAPKQKHESKFWWIIRRGSAGLRIRQERIEQWPMYSD